jgi:hypothetical protein
MRFVLIAALSSGCMTASDYVRAEAGGVAPRSEVASSEDYRSDGSCPGRCMERFDRCTAENSRAANKAEAMAMLQDSGAGAGAAISGVAHDRSVYQARMAAAGSERTMGFERCKALADYCMTACSGQ